jgi:sugar transferase (PEP-CTERM/EpsH1 system associated)
MEDLRILFVTPYVPSPLRVRPYNLIRHLSQQGDRVTVVTVCSSHTDHAEASDLEAHCERVATVRVPLRRSLWNCARALANGLPLQAAYSHSPALDRLLHAEVRSGGTSRQAATTTRCDVAHIEHLRAALAGLSIIGVPRVYDAVDCISRLFEKTLRMSATFPGRFKALVDLERTRRFEAGLIGRFDRILTTSSADRRALLDLARNGPAPLPQHGAGRDAINVVPNGVDVSYFRPTDEPRDPATLVFVGRMGYHANVTAVVHFVEEILPLIWARRPEVKLVVVGKHPSREVKALPRRYGPRIEVTGYVPDVRPYFARSTIAVSPLVYGVGVQNKVLEAMAMGTPVVTTAPAVASLRVRHGEDLVVAHHARDFAAQVCHLLGDERRRRRLGHAARRYVEAHHDWNAIVRELRGIYHDEISRFRDRAGLECTAARDNGH